MYYAVRREVRFLHLIQIYTINQLFLSAEIIQVLYKNLHEAKFTR